MRAAHSNRSPPLVQAAFYPDEIVSLQGRGSVQAISGLVDSRSQGCDDHSCGAGPGTPTLGSP